MWINELPIVMIRCLIITILIETISAFVLGIREKRDFLNIILVNIVTNPLVVTIPVYFGYRVGMLERYISLVILEIIAFVFEGMIYYRFLNNKKINGFLLSFLLNCFSFLLGEFFNKIL